MAELISFKEVKARKKHICGLCNKDIEPGEQYYRQFIKGDEGNVYTFNNHIDCQMLVDKVVVPWTGESEIDSEDFYYACNEFGYKHLCPLCNNWNKQNAECMEDNSTGYECLSYLIEYVKNNEVNIE